MLRESDGAGGMAGAVRGIPKLMGGLFLLNLLLLTPGWIHMGGAEAPWLAPEAFLLVGIFALLPRSRGTTVLAGMVGMALMVFTLLALGDAAARMSLARPLNLYLDIHLLSPVLNLLQGMLGPGRTALAVAGAVFLLLLLPVAVALLLSRLATPTAPRPGRVLGVGLLALVPVGFAGEVVPPVRDGFRAPVVQLVREQVRYISSMLEERERFAAELAASPASFARLPGLLEGLGGRDVILAFVESYGMTAVEDERYAPVIRPRLEEMEERLTAAGLHLVTGVLDAPTRGGQSWLGRGSLLTGLWLENQLRYELLLASDRESLVDDFRHADYRTVALMPAITMAWPEGERFGYQRIYAHRDIGYAGPPLNWVTMPDQFTWSYLERRVRGEDDDGRPLFAEVGLISSHAPWTPILPVLEDWGAIGDGSIFLPWAAAGERPEDLWRDHERVREHFALSVDYALQAAIAYAERYVDERTLLILLGDHQPAPLITGEGAGLGVPVHVIATDPELIEPFREWGFRPGALPDPGAPQRGMDLFREWFVGAYSTPIPAASPRSQP